MSYVLHHFRSLEKMTHYPLPALCHSHFLFHTGSFFIASALALASAFPNLNVVQRLQLIPDASTLVTAVVAGGLATALSGTGPFTVFA